MKITIYELLGMVKDGKAPKRFKYDSCVWTYNYESSAYWNGKGIEFEDYMDDGLMKYLNDEVEIIEEEKKIPEKIDIYEDEEGHYFIDKHCKKIYITCDEVNFMVEEFNQLIDYLKSKGE